jgi:hypothetical protein
MSGQILLFSLLLALPQLGIAGQGVWKVDRVPILDVSGVGADGKVVFIEAIGATRLANGSLLIADRAEYNIRVVDAGGKLVKSVGRFGDGPGEFRSMIWAGGCGADSMLVWDPSHRKASMIGSGGVVARQFAVPAGDTGQTPFQFSCSLNKTMAFLSPPTPVRGAPRMKDPSITSSTASLYRISTSGTIIQRFGDMPAGDIVPMMSQNGGHGAAPRPLSWTPLFTVVGSSVVTSSSDSASVRIMQSDGTGRKISIPVTMRAPTRADFVAAIEAMIWRIPLGVRGGIKEQLAAVPMPDHLPAISGLFGDSEGMLWVQTSLPGAKVVDLVVMRLDGSVSARAQVPVALTVYEIGREYILGSYVDTNDEMHIAIYRLTRQ